MIQAKILNRSAALILLCFYSVITSAQAYKSPVFTDSDRMKKIEATFPVIDKIYHDYAGQNHFPGMVSGILVDGKLVHSGNIGYSDLKDKTLSGTQSDFRIASMSKSFTAMAILK